MSTALLPTPFVRLPLFDGPLDLLLHLCKRQEVSVTELRISEVTEQFLAYLEVLEELHIEVAGEFVEIAALLCLIKSREILPRVVIPGEEEEDEEGADPRAELIARLLNYKRYREAARELEAAPQLHREFFVRRFPPRESAGLEDSDLPIEADLTQLLAALRDLLEERAKGEPVHAAPRPFLSLEVRMNALLQRLGEEDSVAFARLFDEDRTVAMVVVSFLAILELAKWRHLKVVQDGHLDGIRVERLFEGPPPVIPQPGREQ
ncbi:MAG: segregation/condensation protein A [Myxococcota bacterium]|nr:segregation/condensation protein A [Myxococcota bacterium]